MTNSVLININLGIDNNKSSSVAVDANQNVWVANDQTLTRINPLNNSVDFNLLLPSQISHNSIPLTGSMGDFTGFALQNFVLPHGWKMYGGNNDANIFISTDGNHKIEYYSLDNVGNIEDLNTIWVSIDTIPPITIDDHNSGGWQATDANIHLTCSDSGSDCNSTKYRLNSGSWLDYDYNILINTDGNTRVDYNSTDNAGNIEITNSIWVALDKSAPSTTDDHLPNWRNGLSTTLNCTDSKSGCALTQYKVDDNASGWQDGLTIIFNGDGNHKVDYNSLDNVGNMESTHTIWVAKENVPPITSDDHNAGAQNTDANIHLTCFDATSGCYGFMDTQYKINSGEWNFYDTNILISSDGNNRLDYFSTDIAGNIEVIKTAWIYINKSPPTTTDDHNAGWQATDSNTHLTCVDSDGCFLTQYRVDSGAWFDYDYNILISSDGNHRLDYNSKDTLGNIEAVNSVWVAIDKTPPSTTDNHIAGWATGTSITLSPSDSDSGVASTEYIVDLNADAWFSGTIIIFNSDGNHRVDYNSIDAVGNLEATHTIWVALDNIAPITIDDHNAGAQNTDANIHLTCSDSNSGCFLTQYRIDLGSWLDYDFNILISSDGNYRVDYNSIDNAGNIETTNSIWVVIDKALPITTDDHNAGWQTSDANIHLTCTSISGCALTQYRINLSAWVDYDYNILIHQDGNWQLDYNSQNVLGGIESTISIWVAIDKTPPTISSNYSGTQQAGFTLTLTCFDATSDCNEIYYALDANEEDSLDYSAFTLYSSPLQYLADGNFGLQYYGTDKAGNTSSTIEEYILIQTLETPANPPRFLSQTDNRSLDFNRYLSQEDTRTIDSNRYSTQSDTRFDTKNAWDAFLDFIKTLFGQ
jgi:hypothetical protein